MQFKRIGKYLLTTFIISILIVSSGYLYKDSVIQIDVNGILNTRPVTTLTKGELITWANGVDKQNGYLSMAAAKFKGDTDPKALPDDPLIPANNHHPAILLHYSNDEGAKYQARYVADTAGFTIKVPHYKYKDIYLSLTSAYGASVLQIELIYKDGTETKSFTVPDWFKDLADNDPDYSYVIHDRAKWGSKNNLVEKDHHNIDALNIHPDPKRVLITIRLKKLSATYVVFWAATGVRI